MNQNAVIAINAKIPHDLLTLENTVVRLSLSKYDQAERVEAVADL